MCRAAQPAHSDSHSTIAHQRSRGRCGAALTSAGPQPVPARGGGQPAGNSARERRACRCAGQRGGGRGWAEAQAAAAALPGRQGAGRGGRRRGRRRVCAVCSFGEAPQQQGCASVALPWLEKSCGSADRCWTRSLCIKTHCCQRPASASCMKHLHSDAGLQPAHPTPPSCPVHFDSRRQTTRRRPSPCAP